MKQEDRILLFKDICARLPYGVDCLIEHNGEHLDTIIAVDVTTHVVFTEVGNCWLELDFIKPYLRPMSSMTKEELYEVQKILGKGVEIQDDFISIVDSSINSFTYLELQAVFDWLNAHHFDYHGLIKKGLALEAPKDMYVTNQ